MTPEQEKFKNEVGNSVTFAQLKTYLKLVEDKIPEEFDNHRPRKFLVPSGYANPSLVAYSAFRSLKQKQDGKIPITVYQGVLLMTWHYMLEYNMPVYFVSNDMALGAIKTSPPTDINFNNIKWPLEAMLFMLPMSLLRKLNVELLWSTVCRVTFNGKQEVAFTSVLKDKNDKLYYGSLILPMEYNFSEIEDLSVDPKTPEEFELLCVQIAKLTLNLLLIMNARPELVEHGKKIPRKSAYIKSKAELWKPNFLGAKLVINQKEHSEVSPRMHWRRGHFRHQRYGKLLSEIKIIWIEPVLVNPT